MYTAVGSHGTAHGIAGLQQRVDAAQTLPALFCDGEGCTAQVRFVPEHTRTGADRVPVTIPAGIQLEKDAEHAPTCRYNVPGRLDALLASTLDPALVHRLEDGRHELRLLPLHQDLKRGGGPALDAHLRTMNALLVLRAMCDDDALLDARVVLRLGKKRVAWDAFFYALDRYDAAWERVDAASNEIPLALSGTVRSHRAAQPGADFSTTFLNCAPKYQHTGIVDERVFVEVSVGHDDAAWLQSFPVGTQVVMLGLWRLGRTSTATRPHPTDPRRTITNVTYKLALRPVSKQQLVAVS